MLKLHITVSIFLEFTRISKNSVLIREQKYLKGHSKIIFSFLSLKFMFKF